MLEKKYLLSIDNQSFKQKAFAWTQANAFPIITYLDNNQTPRKEQNADNWEAILAIGAKNQVTQKWGETDFAFQKLKEFEINRDKKSWIFGVLSYDLKNEIEPNLVSDNEDELDFPNLHFFEPQILIKIYQNYVKITADTGGGAFSVYKTILEQSIDDLTNGFDPKSPISLKRKFEKSEYLDVIAQLRAHIEAGDFYEINFCQAFFSTDFTEKQLSESAAFSLFWRLNAIAKTPFAAFYRFNEHFLLCASPERFLQKKGRKLISQPIKGTSRRGKTEEEDTFLKNELQNDEKNRAENVMIVDLVRNDLARVCATGSIEVTELFGIQAFESVFQMVSTIEGKLRPRKTWIDALEATFPMGSMTGAPKVAAMQSIEHYERTRRGLYSGAVGYVAPTGDFDFNVVIRSILYNSIRKNMSFQVGGAIVYDSVAEAEFEECEIKMRTILQALGIKNI